MSVQRDEDLLAGRLRDTFDSAEEIPSVANRTRYGLAASVWTRDLKALRLAKTLNAGAVWINCMNLFDPNLPWGGYEEIRLGMREWRGRP